MVGVGGGGENQLVRKESFVVGFIQAYPLVMAIQYLSIYLYIYIYMSRFLNIQANVIRHMKWEYSALYLYV